VSEDIKMADVFGTSIYDDPVSRLSGSIVLYGPEKDAAIHAISNHDNLTQQVAELRAALSELIDKASECDSWESFPSQYLYEASKALEENQ
jgi:hypothetical protein